MQRLHSIEMLRKIVFSFLIFNFLLQIGNPFQRVAAFSDADVEECMMGLELSEMLKLTHSVERMVEDGSFDGYILEENAENHTRKKEKENVEEKQPEQKEESCPSTQNCMKPVAMALTGRSYYDSSEHHNHHHSQQPWQPQKEEKQSKLTTLFNISIAALSFFSFGGYLICLIVHAIKSKGTTFLYPVTTTEASTDVDDDDTTIKIYRRGPR